MNKYECKFCGYTANDSAFLDMVCPACCRGIEGNGDRIENCVPTVFHVEDNYENSI